MNSFPPRTATLLYELDKKLMVLLRDGRTLIGYLRSVDQYANLLLQQTVERIHVGRKFGDIPRGVFLVRGENVVLLGEIDSLQEADQMFERVSIGEILALQKQEQDAKTERAKSIERSLKRRTTRYPPDIIQDDFL
ncbi:Sm-like protein Lsm1,LSM domain, eukaryotic/archaea-type,LSM domain [Cinara cedri]|uniref:U6 snRNA-associated Sm-like protein LSm1 n=1 Tax=Cinara cedri TaxID=506608 RepID=A0A5E4N802_9HEMI|nr:Sm-like protein Lsm1,LSM domain, eukaryotic/archaea-type,LSM domain [Cinara cedri]